MKRTKLIELLSTFSRQEFKDFGKFLSSPFFARGRDLMPLYNVLKKHHPGYAEEKVIRQKVFSELNHGREYNDKVMRVLISEMSSSAEEFLIYNRLKSSPAIKEKLLAQEFSRRNLSHNAGKIAKEIHGLYQGDFTNLVEIYYVYEALRAVSFEKGERKNSALAVYDEAEALCLFFISAASKIRHEMNTLSRLEGEDYSRSPLAILLEDISFSKVFETADWKTGDAVSHAEMYYLASQTYSNIGNRDFFDKFYNAVKNNSAAIAKTERKILFSLLQNMCVVNMQNSDRSFIDDIVRLYDDLLEGYFYDMDSEPINPLLYRNIFKTFSGKKMEDKTLNFIGKYTPALPEDSRENMYNYAASYLNMNMGNYGKSLEYLVKVKLFDETAKLDSMLIKMICYFELGYVEEARNLVNSSRYFLSTEISNPLIKKYFTTFTEIYNLLLRFEDRKDEGILNEIEMMINKYKIIPFMEWINLKTENAYKSTGIKKKK